MRTSEIRDWLIAQDDKENPGYHTAKSSGEVPEAYGSYNSYDGLRMMQAGVSKNLRRAFDDCSYRLSQAAVPIFRWKPDSDGSVAVYLNHDDTKDTDDTIECSFCGGVGRVPEVRA